VLAYKKKRNIINRSYQTQADNIVGKMTIAALDKEVFAKENQDTCRLFLACPCDTQNPPVLRLGFAFPGARAGRPAPPTPALVIQRAFQASRATLKQAIASLSSVIRALQARARGKGDLAPENQRVLKAAKKWLSLRTPADKAAAAAHIQTAVNLMQKNLAVRTSEGAIPSMTQVSDEFHGSTDGNPDHGLQCGAQFFSSDGPNCRRDVNTHEFFHFIGVKHGGSALDGPTIRANITTPALALDSADNLA
jgi:hypothetical protein